jgi:hypothetical protein
MAPSRLADGHTLQRAVCPGGWRKANDDPTAIEAADKIEQAYNKLNAIKDDPGVPQQAKLEMVQALETSIAALRAYMKAIDGTCGGGGASSLMLGQAGTMDPLSVALAALAFALVGSVIVGMSMSEQHSREALGHAFERLSNAVKNLVERPEPEVSETTPEPAEPQKTIDLSPKVGPSPQPAPDDDKRRRKSPCGGFALPVATWEDFHHYSKQPLSGPIRKGQDWVDYSTNSQSEARAATGVPDNLCYRATLKEDASAPHIPHGSWTDRRFFSTVYGQNVSARHFTAVADVPPDKYAVRILDAKV